MRVCDKPLVSKEASVDRGGTGGSLVTGGANQSTNDSGTEAAY